MKWLPEKSPSSLFMESPGPAPPREVSFVQYKKKKVEEE